MLIAKAKLTAQALNARMDDMPTDSDLAGMCERIGRRAGVA
jgi:hypothetical protein